MATSSLAATNTTGSGSGSISTIHPDIIETHVLSRLDASALASTSCVSSQLHSLIASNESLWTNICNSTWPSTDIPRLRHVISSFPNGPRSFFSDSFTNPDIAASSSPVNLDCPSGLISAVDIYYQHKPVLSKAVLTESFDTSPFRVDLLDPKDSVPTGVGQPVNEDLSRELGERLTLSWILIDPIGRRAMNLSSYKPLTVERRSLSTGEVHVRYGWVFNAGEKGSTTECVRCGISVTCEGSQNQSGEMHVTKVSLELEDMYGKQLSGKDSLVILRKGMAGKRGNVKGREEEGKRRNEDYREMRREKILSEVKKHQGRIDTLYMAFGALIFASLGLVVSRIFMSLFL
ncbi:probable F-box protein At2g36090 [Citrus sinensis]|uniref:probable F-box protein At2g36090 n=1 Tax=Citrus sinensis TaxID=2711 RepID=UPI000D627B50|nr:probable F-box protein At2g36090 [Citrus sinensis]